MTAVPHIRGLVQRWLALLLIALVIAPLPATAGDDAVIVTLGEPSAWSLEQAHYLVERMHAVNHGLSSKKPDSDALDPNAINGSRVEVMRTLLGVAGEFNAPLAAENQAALQSFQLNLDRRRNLQAQLDQSRVRHQELSIQIAGLQSEHALLSATSAEAIQLKKQIDILIGEKTALETRMASITTELNAPVANPDLTAPNPSIGGDSGVAPAFGDPMTSTLINKALEGTGSGVGDPSLHVSTVLDNHIQMQYEIIAKQLSLLRDEVGPDQRVIFLELPVSIYTVPKAADKRLVRVRWKIDGVCLDKDFKGQVGLGWQANIRTMADLGTRSAFRDFLALQPPLKLKQWRREMASDLEEREESKPYTQQAEGAPGYKNVVQICDGYNLWENVDSLGRRYSEDSLYITGGDLPRARIVDLVPRQSALNVNQIYDTSNAFSFGLRALWSGFGAAAQFQRQRELFEQFIHQDVFASAFGKGETEFGWTFGPLPGTKRIAPGVRSTFAVVVLPRDAVAIRLRSAHDIYKQREIPRDSISDKNSYFPIPLPSVDQGFRVKRVTYNAVEPGKRVTVFLTGEGFSAQTGVLVGGVPLKRAISIGRPALLSNEVAAQFVGAPAEGIDGEFELVNPRRMVVSFSAGGSYEGTPSITLVSPQLSNVINHFTMDVNGTSRTSLIKESIRQPMFISRLALKRAVLKCPPLGQAGDCDFEIFGKGFRPTADNDNKIQIRIGGEDATLTFVEATTTRLSGKIKKPSGVDVEVYVRQWNRQGQEEDSLKIPHPQVLRISSHEVLAFEDSKKYVHVKIGIQGADPKSVTVEQVGFALPPTTVLATGELAVKLDNSSDVLLVKVTQPPSIEAALAQIIIPEPPKLRAIVGPTGKNSGPAGGGYLVTLKGKSLQDVKRVFFNASPAVVQRVTPSELVVTAPPGSGEVLIRLETDVKFLGRLLESEGDSTSFIYEPPKS